jgi:chromosome condensin MukBEF complex kleisin-like MukF subunit
LIDRIAEQARPHSPKGVEASCDDLSRRLQSVAQWTTQRAIDWVEHHNVVHHLLRTSVRIDRQRRITDALKRAIATDPGWTLEVADEPYLFRMRDDVVRDPKPRKAPTCCFAT